MSEPHPTDPAAARGGTSPERRLTEVVQRRFTWTALWGARRLRQGLRKAGVPVPRVHTFRRRSPIGTPPGTLISHPEAAPPSIRVLGFSTEGYEEIDATLEGLAGLRERWPVVWVDVGGVGHAESVAAIGTEFGLHRLALEDVMNVHQRPKVEEYASYLFAVARMASLGERVDTEQISMFLGPGWVLTFQEAPGDCWDPVRERVRVGKGKIRSGGADYLFYALLDAIIDNFYPLLEEFGARLEQLEEAVIDDPHERLVGVIHGARRDLLALRHALWPMREAVGQLYRDPHQYITDDSRLYLRDAYDHTIQVIDLLENFREMASGLLDVYLSSVSHRMNEVMKVLTIIATIFIPLTFIAGVYGMNFDTSASRWNMPELHWAYGYPVVMGIMFMIGLSLLGYFRWKRWI